MRRVNSGVWIVALIVGVGALGAGLTWLQYEASHPASVNAMLVNQEGQWLAVAYFPAGTALHIARGTRAIVSSPMFPGRKLTGSVKAVETNGAVTIQLDKSPSKSRIDAAPCAVTIDLTTAASGED